MTPIISEELHKKQEAWHKWPTLEVTLMRMSIQRTFMDAKLAASELLRKIVLQRKSKSLRNRKKKF